MWVTVYSVQFVSDTYSDLFAWANYVVVLGLWQGLKLVVSVVIVVLCKAMGMLYLTILKVVPENVNIWSIFYDSEIGFGIVSFC